MHVCTYNYYIDRVSIDFTGELASLAIICKRIQENVPCSQMINCSNGALDVV